RTTIVARVGTIMITPNLTQIGRSRNRRQDHWRRGPLGFEVVARSLTFLPPLAPIDRNRRTPLDRELRCAQPAHGRSHGALRLAPIDRELRCAQPAHGRSHGALRLAPLDREL